MQATYACTNYAATALKRESRAEQKERGRENIKAYLQHGALPQRVVRLPLRNGTGQRGALNVEHMASICTRNVAQAGG